MNKAKVLELAQQATEMDAPPIHRSGLWKFSTAELIRFASAIENEGMTKVSNLEAELANTREHFDKTMDELETAQNALQWYKRRCDALQKEQHRMRDPERIMVCDILANGSLCQIGTGEVDSKRYAVNAEKDAIRYRWLKENSARISWNPARFNEHIVDGFTAFGTGYLGYSFEQAIDLAMQAGDSND